MTMPHSKRPRRNRVNKLRAKKGLPPLEKFTDEVATGIEADAKVTPIGVTTIMVPLPTPVRALLTKVRRAAQMKDPSTVASDQLFAGAVLTAMLPAMEQQLAGPSMIAAPTPANMEKAQKVGKVLAQGYHG